MTITVRELTRKCSIHGTPLASRPVDGTKGQLVGLLMWCPICDHAAKNINYSR
jgi:hypothetical protein